MEVILGMVYMFSGTFVPDGFAACNGQLVQIAQNQALFSLMGTTYGGDGMTTFALPKLAAPTPGINYVVAIRGVYPSRSQ